MKEPRNFFDSPRFDNQRNNQKTLHDLKLAGGHLIAVCKRCLRRAEVKPDDVIPTLGWDFPLFGMRQMVSVLFVSMTLAVLAGAILLWYFYFFSPGTLR